MALLEHVDDIIIAGNAENEVRLLKVALSKKFKMKDIGPLKFSWG